MTQKITTLLLTFAAFATYLKFVYRVEGTWFEKVKFVVASLTNNVDHYAGRHESDYQNSRTQLYSQIAA